jgi:nanoRNase/pAp phosphatase (c-di-AMP/oligoRNAs hydrolase)
MLLTNNIIILIRKYKRISIFFHEYPDGDALGSAYGLQKYLQNLFPNKTIKIVGTDLLKESEKFDIFDSQETVSKTFISQSLGIILDTANSARVFTQQHILCDDVVLIDHHPQQEKYCSIELIDPSYSSTCEMIYELIKQTDPNHFDEVIAKYLYIGIMTDTG